MRVLYSEIRARSSNMSPDISSISAAHFVPRCTFLVSLGRFEAPHVEALFCTGENEDRRAIVVHGSLHLSPLLEMMTPVSSQTMPSRSRNVSPDPAFRPIAFNSGPSYRNELQGHSVTPDEADTAAIHLATAGKLVEHVLMVDSVAALPTGLTTRPVRARKSTAPNPQSLAS